MAPKVIGHYFIWAPLDGKNAIPVHFEDLPLNDIVGMVCYIADNLRRFDIVTSAFMYEGTRRTEFEQIVEEQREVLIDRKICFVGDLFDIANNAAAFICKQFGGALPNLNIVTKQNRSTNSQLSSEYMIPKHLSTSVDGAAVFCRLLIVLH